MQLIMSSTISLASIVTVDDKKENVLAQEEEEARDKMGTICTSSRIERFTKPRQ